MYKLTSLPVLLSVLILPSLARGQSDPANFENLSNFPRDVLGNPVNGPLAGATLPILPQTTQFNFNAGGVSNNNTITGLGNEINLFTGSTAENLTLAAGATLNLLGGNLTGGLTLNGLAAPQPTTGNLLSGSITGSVSINGPVNSAIQTTVTGSLDVDFGATTTLVEVLPGADLGGLTIGAASVNVTGGVIGPVDASPSARLTITGGQFVSTFDVDGDSFLNIAGGDFNQIDIDVLNDVNIAGGSFNALDVTSTSATVNIAAGQFGDGEFLAGFDARVNIRGGTFGDNFQVEDDSVVTISGGTFAANFDVDDNATLNLVGTQFLIDGLDVTAAATAPGGIAINPLAPPMLIEAVLTDGSSVAFAFQPESLQLAEEVSTLDPNATVNLIVGTPQLDGDFNADLAVNAADYVVWRDSLDNFVSGVDELSEAPISFNGDGLFGVDQGDYALWVASFGASALPITAAAAIPEPSGLALVLGLLAIAPGFFFGRA